MVKIMFQGYEIKQLNDEEVLYLYLDLNTEFAKNCLHEKKTTLNKEINDYLAKEKIPFHGKKIFLVASGIILGTCLLTSPLLNTSPEPISPNYQYTSNVLTYDTLEDTSVANDENKENVESEEKIEDTKQEQTSANTNANSNTNTTTNTNQANNNKTTSSNSPTINSSEKAVTNESTKTTTSTDASQTQTTNTDETTKQMVTMKRSNGTILTLELEEYLIGVVAAEMPASFQVEALKAQAIAARTYTMKAIENHITLTDTVSTQVYKDNSELKSMWGSSYQTYYNKVKSAVDSTKGIVMTYNGELIQAYYHSTSNGYTEDATAVFGYYPYLQSVNSEVDKNVSSYLRTITLTYEEVSNKLGIPVTSLSTINIERNATNHVNKIVIDNNLYGGVEFRTTLGLRSTDFDIVLNEENISITTRGYGHGVGMSQYGTNEYAKLGYSYEWILKHYYTGIALKKL